MATDPYKDPLPASQNEGLTRRKLIAGGAGIAGLATAITVAQANTQKPPQPTAKTNSKGRFADKVVLITGATSGIGEQLRALLPVKVRFLERCFIVDRN